VEKVVGRPGYFPSVRGQEKATSSQSKRRGLKEKKRKEKKRPHLPGGKRGDKKEKNEWI
jgi:hypothetical protein